MIIMGWFFKLASVYQRRRSSLEDSAKGMLRPPPKEEAKHATSKFIDCDYDWATGKKGALIRGDSLHLW